MRRSRMCEVRKSKSISPMIDFSTGLLDACYVYVYRFVTAGSYAYVGDSITDVGAQTYHDDIRSCLGLQIARNKKLLTKGQH